MKRILDVMGIVVVATGLVALPAGCQSTDGDRTVRQVEVEGGSYEREVIVEHDGYEREVEVQEQNGMRREVEVERDIDVDDNRMTIDRDVDVEFD